MRDRRQTYVLATTVLTLALSSTAFAQSKDALVGTWKLASASDLTEKGEVRPAPYGQHPTGFLTYTADGRMTGIITDDGRKPLSVTGKRNPPAEERAEAFSTLIAYAGRYTVTGDKVTHHVEAAWIQNWANTDQVRLIVKLDKNQLIIRTILPFVRDGVRIAYQELVWERLK